MNRLELIKELSALKDRLCGFCEQLAVGNCANCEIPICQDHSEILDSKLYCFVCETAIECQQSRIDQ